jgi:hypothetical protein
MMFDDQTPLGEAREWLRERADDGASCPCCTQFAKVYRRKIHATMARELILVYRHAGLGVFDLPPLVPNSGDLPKTRFWGLLARVDGVREDGSRRVGLWRVTDAGQQFVLMRLAVPKYARIYDGRCLGLVGAPVTIRDCLGSRFNYDELMRGV